MTIIMIMIMIMMTLVEILVINRDSGGSCSSGGPKQCQTIPAQIQFWHMMSKIPWRKQKPWTEDTAIKWLHILLLQPLPQVSPHVGQPPDNYQNCCVSKGIIIVRCLAWCPESGPLVPGARAQCESSKSMLDVYNKSRTLHSHMYTHEQHWCCKCVFTSLLHCALFH